MGRTSGSDCGRAIQQDCRGRDSPLLFCEGFMMSTKGPRAGGHGAQERAFAHPTSDSSRSKPALITEPHLALVHSIHGSLAQPFQRRLEQQPVIFLPHGVVRRAGEVDENLRFRAKISPAPCRSSAICAWVSLMATVLSIEPLLVFWARSLPKSAGKDEAPKAEKAKPRKITAS